MRRGICKCCTNRCVLSALLFFICVNAGLFVWLDVGNSSSTGADNDGLNTAGDIASGNEGLFAGIGGWIWGRRRRCPHKPEYVVSCPPCRGGKAVDSGDEIRPPGREIEPHPGMKIMKNSKDANFASIREERDVDPAFNKPSDTLANSKLIGGNPITNLHNIVRDSNVIEHEKDTEEVVEPPPLENAGKPDEIHHHLCILIPYRDRFEELLESIPHLHSFLSNQSLSFMAAQPKSQQLNEEGEELEDIGGGYAFDIIVLNQVDLLRFNRASLINVGYFEAQRLGCDYFAMHDVDLLPLNPALNYGYPGRLPYHVASPEYHPRYHYEKFIGGILILTLAQFRHVNGMSNRYWGWGLEDDEFYVRLKEADLIPRRPTGLTTGQRDTFYHIHNAKQRPRDSARLYDQKKVSRRRDRVTGLDSLQYSIRARYNITVNQARAVVVEVELSCDLDYTPWCQFPSAIAQKGGEVAHGMNAAGQNRPVNRKPRLKKPYDPKFVD